MLKRIYAVFVIVLLFCVFSLYAQECQIDSYGSECIIFDSPYNIFNLDISDEDDLDSFNARIFNKYNINNEIQVSIEENSIENLDPFTEPGVYILEVVAYNRRKTPTVKEFEFIFDNSNPKPLVIEPNLRTDTNEIIIIGYGNPLHTVVAQRKNGDILREMRPQENGTFSLTLNNINSNNRALVYFHSENANGIKSDTIERIIYFEEESPSNEQNVGSITISDLSLVTPSNTVKVSENSYISKKRNFYVEGTLTGTTQKGVPVYINGNKVLSASDNTFAGFVLLNKGENILEIKTKEVSTYVNVTYLDMDFRFTSNPLEDVKVVSQNTLTINGSTNVDLPVIVYVNGEGSSLVVQDGTYSTQIIGLKSGKNYVYIEGYNGEYISDYIYYDTQEPQIEVVSETSFLNNSYDLVFKITDDTGVDLETMDVIIDGVEVSTNKIQRVSNYYMVNLRSYADGEHSYKVVARDRVLKSSSISGTFSINPDLTSIGRIDFDERLSRRIGNHLFLQEGMNRLKLHFSENVAFKSVKLDGREVIDYSINSDDSVDLRLNISEPSGELVLVYINSKGDVFTRNFKYYSSLGESILKLNYVDKSGYGQGSFARVSGQIIGSSFNYSSLRVGGSNNYVLYGDYFEAIFLPGSSSDSLVRGYDISGNKVEIELPVFYDDSSNSIKLDRHSKLISGRMDGSNDYTNSLVYSYEASDSNLFIINDNGFKLSPVDRLGLRAPLLKGIESSRNSFDSYRGIISVDNMKPKVYFVSSGGDVNVLIDGTFSDIDTGSLNIMVDGSPSNLGGCSNYDKISLHDDCYSVSGGASRAISVNVSDMAGNSLYKEFTGTLNSNPEREDIDFEIYFNGNDLLTNKDYGVIQGQITSKSILTDVSVNGDSCHFDDFSFVCFIDLSRGANSFTVNTRNLGGDETEKEIVITRDDLLSIEITGLSQKGISFDISDVQFANDFNVFVINGTVDRNVSVSTLINDCCQENSKEPKAKGEFTIELDISQRVFGKSEDEFNVSLRAIDDLGNEATSNKIKFIFKRVFSTIIQIFVG